LAHTAIAKAFLAIFIHTATVASRGGLRNFRVGVVRARGGNHEREQ
jgi:hypothetical protein